MLFIEKKFHIVFQKCFLCPSAVPSSYFAKFHLRYSFIIKKYKSFLNSLGSSIHSALVIRLQVEIMMICQGKIIVIYAISNIKFMNHVQVVLHLQIPTLTKLFASAKPIKIIQICKMPGKQATFQKMIL